MFNFLLYQRNKNIQYFRVIPVFDALMYSLSAVHNLSKDDRRFYYDTINQLYQPIYYDGDAKIIDINNNINESFKNINNNWYFSMIDENNTSFIDYKKHVTLSAKVGAKKAKNLINNIDIIELTNNINKRYMYHTW